jgi:UDP-N-acetylmuramoyl-L-alanyl-D-glutamate--2,6-diaminopimelate ligase
MIQSLKNVAHLILAGFANIFYGFPSKHMVMIGVTGTDGKTTTASLIYDILQKSGKKTALLTTVSATIDGKSYDTGFHVTTPNSIHLQKYLSLAKRAGVTHFVLETTSHALDQNRVFGIHFAVSVVTNIANEHLDYHKTFERYVAAKAKIIKKSDICVVNHDDTSFPYLKEYAQKYADSVKLVTYGLHTDADFTGKRYHLQPSMPGLFNMYNALAALSVCMELGLTYRECHEVIKSYRTPKGRQDILQKVPFTVMIDFAHTPNSFAALLMAIKTEYTGRIIHVFGSAGERDHVKRPDMGKASSHIADVIVLTAEDPRSESIDTINADILSGISSDFKRYDKGYTPEDIKIVQKKGNKSLFTIPDRKTAIKFALSIAQKDDIVVITGKGHEQSMNFGEGEVLWSDHEAVKSALKN